MNYDLNIDQLLRGLEVKNRELAAATDKSHKFAIAFSDANTELKKKFAEVQAELRASGIPTTILKDQTNGDARVLEASSKADYAKTDHDISKEVIKNIRIAIETIRSMLSYSRLEIGRG